MLSDGEGSTPVRPALLDDAVSAGLTRFRILMLISGEGSTPVRPAYANTRCSNTKYQYAW